MGIGLLRRVKRAIQMVRGSPKDLLLLKSDCIVLMDDTHV